MKLSLVSLCTPVRCTLHRRWTRLALVCVNDREHLSLDQSVSSTVRLNPSLSVSRLAIFWMRQARVHLVAIVRLGLAASGQDRDRPYPHVPRASDCSCLLIRSLPGQPRPRGDAGGCLPFPPSWQVPLLHDTALWRASTIIVTVAQSDARCFRKRKNWNF